MCFLNPRKKRKTQAVSYDENRYYIPPPTKYHQLPLNNYNSYQNYHGSTYPYVYPVPHGHISPHMISPPAKLQSHVAYGSVPVATLPHEYAPRKSKSSRTHHAKGAMPRTKAPVAYSSGYMPVPQDSGYKKPNKSKTHYRSPPVVVLPPPTTNSYSYLHPGSTSYYTGSPSYSSSYSQAYGARVSPPISDRHISKDMRRREDTGRALPTLQPIVNHVKPAWPVSYR